MGPEKELSELSSDIYTLHIYPPHKYTLPTNTHTHTYNKMKKIKKRKHWHVKMVIPD